jgi:bleomycin hydrolase
MKKIVCLMVIMAVVGCSRQPSPKHFVVDVLNRMTPVKDQGSSQTCWIYAMLAAIETEHIMRGDSVNLSAAYLEKMLEHEPAAPANRRGMGATALYLAAKYGLVAYDAMRTTDVPMPKRVYMLGAEYTRKEFAHSVSAPGEYVALTSTGDAPYGERVCLDLPDNWNREHFLNVPIDSLLSMTVSAVRAGRGVCWESKAHAMSIVGLAHDEHGRQYFVMKNSWGTRRSSDGLDYLSFSYFRKHTVAVEMPADAIGATAAGAR